MERPGCRSGCFGACRKRGSEIRSAIADGSMALRFLNLSMQVVGPGDSTSDRFSTRSNIDVAVAQLCCIGCHAGVACRPLVGSDFLGIFRLPRRRRSDLSVAIRSDRTMLQLTPYFESA